NQGAADGLTSQVSGQGQSLVLAHILSAEHLARQVGQLHGVMVQQSDMTDALAHQAVAYLTAQPAGADLHDMGARQGGLISARNALEAVEDRLVCVR
ncbi:hypothetical protein LCGC14_2036360, partial [marine sediment metagenome]